MSSFKQPAGGFLLDASKNQLVTMIYLTHSTSISKGRATKCWELCPLGIYSKYDEPCLLGAKSSVWGYSYSWKNRHTLEGTAVTQETVWEPLDYKMKSPDLHFFFWTDKQQAKWPSMEWHSLLTSKTLGTMTLENQEFYSSEGLWADFSYRTHRRYPVEGDFMVY